VCSLLVLCTNVYEDNGASIFDVYEGCAVLLNVTLTTDAHCFPSKMYFHTSFEGPVLCR
jgi:hypothetical protein